jgi:hypothetical protein
MDQQFYEQKHTTTISSNRFKSDNSQPFNLLGTRSCKSPNGTDVSGIGVAIDGRLANRPHLSSLAATFGTSFIPAHLPQADKFPVFAKAVQAATNRINAISKAHTRNRVNLRVISRVT